MQARLPLCLAFVVSVIAFCGTSYAARSRVLLGLDLYRPVPEDNPMTTTKINLGRRLFHDRRLSANGSLSCASCHDGRRAFTSRRTGASRVGGVLVSRDVPTLVNRVWGASFFWDGRAATLEEQVLQPILNPQELGGTREGIVALARSESYRTQFVAAFGRDPAVEQVARALACYVRTIVAGDSPFDRDAAGQRAAMDASARRGLGLFMSKAGCSACHGGPNLTDEKFHNTGVAWRTGRPADEGRGRITGRPEDRGSFKTPTLRQVAQTAPYMHDGSFGTLEEVVAYYDRGGFPAPGLDPRVRTLRLEPSEKAALVAFLRALSGTISEGR